MPTLFLIRGLSGSGKSTFAKLIAYDYSDCGGDPNPQWLETDQYFTYGGEYKFDRSKLHEAHRWCESECETLMQGAFGIVVSNTFSTPKEMKPYLDLAKRYRYEVKVIRLVCTVKTAVKRSIHNVPGSVVARMNGRFQDYPGELVYRTD